MSSGSVLENPSNNRLAITSVLPNAGQIDSTVALTLGLWWVSATFDPFA